MKDGSSLCKWNYSSHCTHGSLTYFLCWWWCVKGSGVDNNERNNILGMQKLQPKELVGRCVVQYLDYKLLNDGFTMIRK